MLLNWEPIMEANSGCGKRWVGKVVLCLCLLLLVFCVPLSCAGRATIITNTGSGSSSQKLEVQKHLKNLNRPPVKSIKVERIFLFLLFQFFFFLSFSFYPLFLFPLPLFFFIDCITVFFSNRDLQQTKAFFFWGGWKELLILVSPLLSHLGSFFLVSFITWGNGESAIVLCSLTLEQNLSMLFSGAPFLGFA